MEASLEKLKGQIPIIDIIKIASDDKPLKYFPYFLAKIYFYFRFHLILKDRTFKMEAATKEIKMKWLEALQICQDYCKEMDRIGKNCLLELL